jgi:hypothetical protein
MQTNTVYIIEKENYGVIGITDSKAAAFSFLIKYCWIVEDTLCDNPWGGDSYTLAEICIEEGITKENFLDWAIFKLENTNFWEKSGFYIRGEDLYTEKTI